MRLRSCLKGIMETVKIVAIYALFGLGWIYGSDTILGWFVHDQAALVTIAVAKGSLFILCTAGAPVFPDQPFRSAIACR